MTVGISRAFRSTDVGAPQLYGTNGSLAALLKAVLVNGYGSVAPLGWTAPFEATNICVFRPAAGVRPFIRVSDAGADPNFADVRAYATMLDVNNGTEPVPSIVQNCTIHKRYTSGAGVIPWIIVGDEAGIYIALRVGYPYWGSGVVRGLLWNIYYYGDYIPFDIRNKWNFFMNGIYDTTTIGGLGNHDNTYSGTYIMRSPTTFLKGAIQTGVDGLARAHHGSMYTPNYGRSIVSGTYFTGGASLYLMSGVYIYYYGILPGIRRIVEGNQNTWGASVSDLLNTDIVDYNGNLQILLSVPGFQTSGWNGAPDINDLFTCVLKVGRGFRNAN